MVTSCVRLKSNRILILCGIYWEYLRWALANIHLYLPLSATDQIIKHEHEFLRCRDGIFRNDGANSRWHLIHLTATSRAGQPGVLEQFFNSAFPPWHNILGKTPGVWAHPPSTWSSLGAAVELCNNCTCDPTASGIFLILLYFYGRPLDATGHDDNFWNHSGPIVEPLLVADTWGAESFVSCTLQEISGSEPWPHKITGGAYTNINTWAHPRPMKSEFLGAEDRYF